MTAFNGFTLMAPWDQIPEETLSSCRPVQICEYCFLPSIQNLIG
jgi:hypothetical protein